jgi:hypothetical protein
MRQTIPKPNFRVTRESVPSIEIDMWEISGPYADGRWHELIFDFVKNWLSKSRFQEEATIWSSVIPSVNFMHPGNSCFIAVFGMPEDFLGNLEDFLKVKIGKCVRLSDYVEVDENDGWRPYLHIKQGRAWEYCDYNEWAEI